MSSLHRYVPKRGSLSVVIAETLQVTHKEGFEILDEVRLKEIIDVM